jgi:TilS substrate binding domain
LPLLVKEFNPHAVEHLSGLAQRAREQTLFMDRLAAQLFDQTVVRDGPALRIPLAGLLNPAGSAQPENAALRNALLHQILAQSKARGGQVSSVHLDAIFRLAQLGEKGKRLQLPGGLDVIREKDSLLFCKRSWARLRPRE